MSPLLNSQPTTSSYLLYRETMASHKEDGGHSPTPTPKCRGYILASQHPNFPSKARTPAAGASPYEIIPCPYEPLSAHHLASTGKGDKMAKGRKHGCVVGNWCERHWCAGCKKGREEKEGRVGAQGLGHGGLEVQEEVIQDQNQHQEMKEGIKEDNEATGSLIQVVEA